MTGPITVLHVFGTMNRGGAETRTIEVMRGLDRGRIRLIFCALSGMPGDLDQEIRELGGDVFYCPLRLRFPSNFTRLLLREHVDVVHSHVATSSGLPLLLARKAGIPIRIAHFRSDSDGRPNTLYHRIRRGIGRKLIDVCATDIIAVTHHSMGAAWRVDWATDSRCQVVYNGVDLARFQTDQAPSSTRDELGLSRNRTLCMHIGRSGKAKNRARVVRIHAEMCKTAGKISLLFVGPPDAEEDRQLLDLASRLGTADLVRFAGLRDDVPRLLYAADLLLQPSVREGLPGVVLEACAAGTPVLATNLPGVHEISRHFPSVRSLSLSDSDEEWAATAFRLLETTATPVDGMAALAAFRSSPFSLGRSSRTLTDVWERLP